MELNEKIREFIKDNIEVIEYERDFTDDENIFELGFVNSLFAMKLLNYVENEFNVEVVPEDMDIANFNSVNNIVEFIERKNGHPGQVSFV
ncbi:MAG: acyl carrier protein [Candidatus Aminicenantes bacterium]